MGEEKNTKAGAPTADAYTQRAYELFWEGRYGEALAAADAALALNARHVRALTTRAVTLVQLGRAREAKAAAEEAIRLDPGDGVAYSILGFCYARLGDDDAAVAHFRRGIETSPADYRVYYNCGSYWAELGNGGECRQYLVEALNLRPAMAKNLLIDPDFARFSAEAWFRELVAEYLARARRETGAARGEP
jgi:Flp pilus assembly protein TadD